MYYSKKRKEKKRKEKKRKEKKRKEEKRREKNTNSQVTSCFSSLNRLSKVSTGKRQK